MMISRKVDNSDGIPSLLEWLVTNVTNGLKAGTVLVTLGREQRNTDQNAKLWACLNDVSRQVVWYGQKLESEDWKHIFTASLVKQKVVPGLDGGFVVCGISTRKMSKQLFSDLIELIMAFGADHKVVWSDNATKIFEEYHAKNTKS